MKDILKDHKDIINGTSVDVIEENIVEENVIVEKESEALEEEVVVRRNIKKLN